MAGSAVGFGGGFGKGLLNVLMQTRQDARQQDMVAQDRKDREFSMLFPVMWQSTLESGDWPGLEEWVGQYQPELVKRFKKEGSPFETLAPMLQMHNRPTTASEQQAIPGMPESVEVPTPQRTSFLGVGMMTPDERTQKALDDLIATTKAQARGKAMGDFEATAEVLGPMMERIQNDVYPTLKTLDPNATIEDAFAVFGIRMPSQANRLGGPMYAGSWQDYVAGKVAEAQARGETPTPDQRRQWRSEFQSSMRAAPSSGTQLDRAAVAMGRGYERFVDVPPDEIEAVIAKAKELEQQFGFSSSYGRGTGTRTAEVDALMKSGIVQTVIDNPMIWSELPSEAKAKLAPLLDSHGFDFVRGAELTPSMAAGISRLSSSLRILQELDAALTQKTGAAGRVAGVAQDWWALLTQEDSPANIYRGISDSLLPALARASGEVGNLAEQEQTRYARLAPKVSDASNVRRAKYAAIQYLIDAANRGATAADMAPFLDYMKFAGRPDTVAPNPESHKAPVYKKDANGNWVLIEPK